MSAVSLSPSGAELAVGSGDAHWLTRLIRRPAACAALAFLLAAAIIALLAPIVLPRVSGQQAGNLLATFQGPSRHHLLGTDGLGRDVLNRLLVGTRITLLGALEGLGTAVAIGLPFGVLAGYLGGRTDHIIGWIVDALLALPALIIVLVVMSVFPHDMLAGMVTFGLITSPFLVRVVRSATLPIREEPFIDAAKVAGLRPAFIITRHIIPRVASAVIVAGSLVAAASVLTQASLAFLGLVVAPPAPSWGGMLNDGVTAIVQQPWLIWPPGVAITLTVLALGLLGAAVRDVTAETWVANAAQMRVKARRLPPPSSQPPTLASGQALLALEDMTVETTAFGATRRIVDAVTFDIGPSEVVGLVGESGCGKTITAMAILGLLPKNVDVCAGRVIFDGADIGSLPERDRARVRGTGIAMISQEPTVSFNPVFRVGWQLADIVRIHLGISRQAAHKRAIELLETVRLPDPELVARRYPHQLSGGMAQRVAIARALAGEPRLLIADEPTTALDVTVQAEILSLLRNVQAERDMAILLVSHDWGVIADLCDRAIVMYAGQVVEEASVVDLFSQPRHPYTEALLNANPHKLVAKKRLPTIPGIVPQPGNWPQGCHFNPRCKYAAAECTSGPIPLFSPAPKHRTRCIHHARVGDT